MDRLILAAIATLACLTPSVARAGTVTFAMSQRSATEAELAYLDVPVGSVVFSYFLSSDSDILAIKNVAITNNGAPANNLYQSKDWDNVSRPTAALISAYPPIGADSYIRLAPTGKSTLLGVDMPGDGTANTAWGDLVTTPAASLQNFQFAQLTIPNPGVFSFRGIVVVDADGITQEFPYSFTVPEPPFSRMLTFILLGLAAIRSTK